MKSRHVLLFSTLAMAPSPANAIEEESRDPVGLSLFFRDGEAPLTDIVGDQRRYIEELDIVATKSSKSNFGIAPVINSGDMATLDWTGVELVEEDWRPDGMGTFTRQRFYRHAAWMEQFSVFLVFQADDDGLLLALPFVAAAGRDDLWSPLDSAFIRRFVARQITTGCEAVGECDQATSHTAEALAQLRHAFRPQLQSRALRSETTRLIIYWTADPGNLREVHLVRRSTEESKYAYGFEPIIDEVSAAPQGFYEPGDHVTFRVRFLDGQGNEFITRGDDMPTYAEFLSGMIESGLRYFDIGITPTTYYALKHRESNMILALSGPTNALAVPETIVDSQQLLDAEQAVIATRETDGFTALGHLIPNFGVIFGGFFDPAIWDTEIPNQYTFTIPADAEPGTYVVALKARRDFAGEALNRGAVTRIQVGSNHPTSWTPTTGNCNLCHVQEAALSRILHGIGDRETCFGCHPSIDIEPDARLDYRVHFVHSRSNRYPGDVWECSTCHLAPPSGPPIGYPGFVYPFD